MWKDHPPNSENAPGCSLSIKCVCAQGGVLKGYFEGPRGHGVSRRVLGRFGYMMASMITIHHETMPKQPWLSRANPGCVPQTWRGVVNRCTLFLSLDPNLFCVHNVWLAVSSAEHARRWPFLNIRRWDVVHNETANMAATPVRAHARSVIRA